MRKTNCNLSRERLQEVLHYDPETGEFRWKALLGRRVKVGAVAGRINDKGYLQVGIDYTLYHAHRLAWLYMTGAWPTKFIDHINGIKADNRFINLREATPAENNQNSRFSCGSSVFRGVSWDAIRKRWRALIMINGKIHHLGFFDIEEDAAEAYRCAQRRLHPFAPMSQTAAETNSGNCKCEPELSPGLTCR